MTQRWPSPRVRGASRSLDIVFYTAPRALVHPGGGEVQMFKTAEYLRRTGVRVRLFDVACGRPDWVHLFGMHRECLEVAHWARGVGACVALSPISWYDPYASWRLEPGAARKLRAVAGWTARRFFPNVPSWRRQLLHAADIVLPNSHAEAEQLRVLFQLEPNRVAAIPNGVDARFLHADPQLFQDQFGVRDYVLVPGRIEPRKNQLAVIRALWGSGLDVVILGDPVASHLDYYAECKREADPGVLFVPQVAHDSALLRSAYAAARVVVLASWFETPGLAALEGAVAGAHIVVTEFGSAREYFGDSAFYVRPDDPASIRSRVRDAMMRPRASAARDITLRNFLWNAVAQRTLAAYVGRSHTSTAQDSVWAAAA